MEGQNGWDGRDDKLYTRGRKGKRAGKVWRKERVCLVGKIEQVGRVGMIERVRMVGRLG